MHRLLGVSLIILSAASFGTLAIIGRFAYSYGLDVTTLLFLRFSFSALVLLGWLALRRTPLPRGRTLLQLAGMGGIGYVGQSLCYLTAIQYASAGLVALLLYLYPAFVAILAAIFLRERLTPLRLGALVLASAGAALTVDPQGGQLTGILLAIGAAAIYAVYIIVGAGVMERVDALQSSAVIFASAGVVFAFLTLLRGPHFPVSAGGWLSVAAIALVATIIPVVTFLAGLKIIGPTDASLLSTLEPVVTVLLAAWLFGEQVRPSMLLGGALILAAVVILSKLSSSRPASASPPAG